MAIRQADVYLLVHRLAEPRGPSCAWYDSRESVLVRLTDDEGVVGWGEAALRPGVVAALAELAEMTIGRDPLDARALFDLVSRTTADWWAVSALAIAIDDLRARRLGVPVYALYGGARRDRVRAYASSGGYYPDRDPEDTWPVEVSEALAAGFTAFKFRVGRFALERELAILEAIRADVGADVDFLADGNGAYSPARAIEMGRGLERLRFRWFEEPLIRTQGSVSYPGYSELARTLDIALAAGEALETRSAFDRFVADGCADIVQPDVSICGGIGEALFVAELAALHARLCVPHAWGGAVTLAATLHLHALLPAPSEVLDADGALLELDTFENPMQTDLLIEPIRLEDGWVSVPTGPGLGIEIDEEFVRRMNVYDVRL